MEAHAHAAHGIGVDVVGASGAEPPLGADDDGGLGACGRGAGAQALAGAVLQGWAPGLGARRGFEGTGVAGARGQGLEFAAVGAGIGVVGGIRKGDVIAVILGVGMVATRGLGQGVDADRVHAGDEELGDVAMRA